jgi:uncharacterized protein
MAAAPPLAPNLLIWSSCPAAALAKEYQMAATFVLQRSTDQQYYFNLRAENNEILLASERYTTKSAAQNGIDAVRLNAPDDSRYARKRSERGQPYFVLTAANGEPVGTSEEYSSADAMEQGIAAVKRVAPAASLVDRA